MSTTSNSDSERSAGQVFIHRASEITRRHLEMVADESAALFVEMLSDLWKAEGSLELTEALAIPRELIAHLRKHYGLDKVHALCGFFLDFFSGGLSGASDGKLSFTNLEFDGLKHFEQKFAHRLPEADKQRLHQLVAALGKAGG